jgi:uncharacterized protein YecE (DUF72 family)
MPIVIATAGWSIPKKDASSFPETGSTLERYASRFGGVEINTSFYRPHRRTTWKRWADSVPDDFRFAVKIPRTITHTRRLIDCREPLAAFCDDVAALGSKLAILLVQLPPSLRFEPDVASAFFGLLPGLTAARIVCEPRHISWFNPEAELLLEENKVSRAAADPSLADRASRPGGWSGLSYWRLHGSPVMYRSAYEDDRLADYARLIRKVASDGRTAWCTFDNTASFAATSDAFKLADLMKL